LGQLDSRLWFDLRAESTTSPNQKVKIYQMAANMKLTGLSDEFISNLVEMSSSYEGAFNLMQMWEEEKDPKEREEIISDLQDEIDDLVSAPKKPTKKPYIKFDDLEVIAKDVKSFKNHLKTLVDSWGGVSKLARETQIPQPSLSRFFNSANMPRRTTLYKIANALGLSEKEIITDWAA
jgi:DNA-binding phage protein